MVQIPPCAFQGSEGRPWIMVSSSEAFASLGEVCTCKHCIHVSGTPEYPVPLVEAFGKLFLSVDGVAGVHDITFSVQDAWNAVPCKSVDDPPRAWVDGGGLHSRPDWSGKEREGKERSSPCIDVLLWRLTFALSPQVEITVSIGDEHLFVRGHIAATMHFW